MKGYFLFKECRIGDTFHVGNDVVKCVEDIDEKYRCDNCYFEKFNIKCKHLIPCTWTERSDMKECYFIKVSES